MARMIEAIVTDIEGTTTCIFFVQEVLFGYSKKRAKRFVRDCAEDPVVADLLDQVRQEAGEPDADNKRVAVIMQGWMEADKKITCLKALQGHIWQYGYEKGHFMSHLYHEVPKYLDRWKADGLGLYIYSSGSIHAQKLILQYSSFGDKRASFDGHFDTTTGPKQEPASYQAIADELGKAPERILFLSDALAELEAARSAGMQTAWLIREDGEADPSASDAFEKCEDFADVHNYLLRLCAPKAAS